MSLTERRQAILRRIVQEYVATATPVASRTIAADSSLGVSSATVRNDVVFLEEEGYVARPHLSAGSVPTEKAYRHYVEWVSHEARPALADELFLSELFREAAREMEQWLKLTAMFLAHLVRNIAVITQPKAMRCRLKHLDLVLMHDLLALLVVVLCEARVRQRTISLRRPMVQNELTALAQKLNSMHGSSTAEEIAAGKAPMSPEEEDVVHALLDVMRAEDRLELGSAHMEGVHLMLSQPEFANSPKPLELLQAMESDDWLESVLHTPEETPIRVIIGGEKPGTPFRELSLVLGEYGVQGKASGVVGVIGPKRMDYARAISSVGSLSLLLSDTIANYM
jgi:heat-inducible transcriptional repressor